MIQDEIALFSCVDEKMERANRIGNVYVQQNEKNTWTKIHAVGLAPKNCYVIFYLIRNEKQKQGVAEVGMTTVSDAGELIFEKTLPNRILDGYYYDEKEIIAVILIEKNDIDLKSPLIGFQKDEIPWKPMLKPYIQALPCNHTNIYAEYAANETYDNMIDNEPQSMHFEKRAKVDKAVEIDDSSWGGLNKTDMVVQIPSGHEKLLLMRLRTGNAVLYALGVPDSFLAERKNEYLRGGFGTFFCNQAGEVSRGDAQGYWCAYL